MPTPEARALRILRKADFRLLFGFIAMVVIFGLLSWRSAINEDHISNNLHRQQVLNYAQCERSFVNTGKINATFTALAEAVSVVRPQTPALLAREHIYLVSLWAYPTCGSKP